MGWPTVCGALIISAGALCGQVSVLTWHNDNARTGQNLQETVLTPANVNSTSFGRLAVLSVDGKVDAQPLYVPNVNIPNQGVHNVLYVATEHGSLYAFDADSFVQLGRVSLMGTNETPSDDHGCSQVTPEIGITATPAIDLQAGSAGVIYVVAMSKDANQHYHQRLHALDLPTLTEQFGGPVEIQASYSGKGAENTFDPSVHKERPGLLISNGVVYTTWGSHCDGGSYAGWVLSYRETTLAQVGVLNLTPNGSEAGIWAAGSGPAIDSSGNVYLLTGNGTFDTTLNGSGFPSKGDYGNAFVKISTGGALTVTDYFTMKNTVSESNADVDLGSGGLMLLPPMDNGQGTGTPVSLVVGAGKDTNIYVLDQSNLGKFSSTTDSIYQLIPNGLPGAAFSSPAWFNGKLYYGGVGDRLRVFTFTAGKFSLAQQSANSFVYPGTTPSISANGNSNGIVWAAENQSPAVLHAYDAENISNELYNSTQAAGGRDSFGNGNKFIVPTVANGKVYVGTTDGVGVFGLLANGIAAITSPAPGSTLPGSSVTFTWSQASGAAAYWLDVGTISGQGNIYGGQLAPSATSQTVSGIPMNGGTIYVKLWTEINGAWSGNSYTYSSAALAAINTPAPGSTLPGASATFTWTQTNSATAYWLDVGTVQGQGNIFASQLAPSATSQTVNNIPTTGQTIYVQLWTQISGTWNLNRYTYTAAAVSTKAVMSTPASGSTLTGSTVTFTWSAGTGASAYWLDVGTVLGQGNIFASQLAPSVTSQIVSNIPTTGQTIYVQLWTQINGTWNLNRYSYTAAGTGTPAQMSTPPPASILTGSTVTFSWSPGTGASAYWLDVGTVLGQGNIFASQLAASVNSQIVSNIPTSGQTVYVQLWTQINGTWNVNRYAYTAAAITTTAVMSTPAPGSTLTGSTVMFTWAPGAGASAYWLDVGTVLGQGNVFASQLPASVTSQTVNNIPTTGQTIYVQLWTQINGAWNLNRYSYTAAAGSTAALMSTPAVARSAPVRR